MTFRRKADQYIDHARSELASAEMMVMHSYTDQAKADALDRLVDAQRYLTRAIAARDAWDSADHDDYEEYPEVPRHSQETMI